MKKKSRFLQTPVEPFAVEGGLSADQILLRMEKISFQGRNLATAHRIWQKMLRDDVTIFLGMAGALSAGGVRLVVAHLNFNRHVDCLVSTGADLYHHLHETRRQHYYVRSPYSHGRAMADSWMGMGQSQARQKTPGAGYIDIIGDIVESANLVIRRPRTASVVLGGGTPKNFINQASVQAEFYSDEVGGHRYALQIVTDVPHFGGASGSSLEEAQSWGKLAADSAKVSVQADATIALPLLATALASSASALLAARKMPVFTLAGQVMTVDGQTVPNER